MIRVNQIKIKHDMNKIMSSEELHDVLIGHVAKLLRVDKENIGEIEIIRRSIDARKKPDIFDIYLVDVALKGANEKKVVNKCKSKDVTVKEKEDYNFNRQVKDIISRQNGVNGPDKDFKLPARMQDANAAEETPIVVIGAGPAGLFCGYMLAKNGFKPIVLERGADVDKRTEIVENFWKTGKLNTSTNVQFGEGGAGTFSDGKLNTMVKDKDGRGREALKIFVSHGAHEEILYDAKPHIGTDVLREVVRNLRKSIIELGGEVHFETKVSEILTDDKAKLTGVVTERSAEGSADEIRRMVIPCNKAVLAIGHSARDTFYMLKDKNVNMEKKPFAVGFRVEHPQSIINKSQYGIENPRTLPPAPYKLTTTTDTGRGVYSFCMCPGGYVVNASSEEGRLAVNGMSYSKRDGNNANSAIIITVDPKDFGSDDILSGVEFQRKLEEKAYQIGQGKIPVELYGDFKAFVKEKSEDDISGNMNAGTEGAEGREDSDWKIEPCMRGEYVFANVHEILPDELNNCFVQGMENFGKIIKGYNNRSALVSGVESRTSSPVRIVRDENCESVNIKGLYPCGEGAGYAGGIMSAAMDGMKVAEHIVADLISCRGELNDQS